MKTQTPRCYLLCFAILFTAACDVFEGGGASTGVATAFDEGGTSIGAFDEAGTSIGASDDGVSATSGIGSGGEWSGTASSGWSPTTGEPCDATHPTSGDGITTDDWGGSSYGSGPWDTATTADPTTPTTATSGWPDTDGATSSPGDDGDPACDLPLAPGGFTYGCECEDPTCDIGYDGVAQIPDFDLYCECLCQAIGCGSAVGGAGEGVGPG